MVKIKGTAILDSITALKLREGVQRYEEVVLLLEEPFMTLFRRGILPMSWYPLDAFVAFLSVGLRLAGEDERVLIARSEAVIERQLRGIYRVFVRLGSPEFVIKRIAAIHQTYFTGVEVSLQLLGPGRATLKYTGFAKQHSLIEYVMIGFFRKALDISGAKAVVVEMSVPLVNGLEYCELCVTWRR